MHVYVHPPLSRAYCEVPNVSSTHSLTLSRRVRITALSCDGPAVRRRRRASRREARVSDITSPRYKFAISLRYHKFARAIYNLPISSMAAILGLDLFIPSDRPRAR